jgi:hypothetical protein
VGPLLIVIAGVALALVATGFMARHRRRGEERAFRDELLGAFGRPIHRERDLPRLGALFVARQADDATLPCLNERTWADLDMDLVFARLDRTASQVGAQVLYDRLRRPDEPSPGLDELCEALRRNPATRERVVTALMPMRPRHASYLCSLLWGSTPEQHRFAWAFVILGGLPVALVLLALLWPRMLILALAAVLVNLTLRLALRPVIDPHVPALRSLPAFIAVARRLAREADPVLCDVTRRIRPHLPALRFLQRGARWIISEPAADAIVMGPLAEAGATIQEYANLVLLRDVNAFHFAARRISANRQALREVFDAIGTLDVALALASSRAGAGERWTRPVVTAGRQLHARDLVHPVLLTPVPNDVVMDGRSWLVTGSNMSGKSTLLRTLGVNAVLARTLGTVLGTHWEGPAYTVRTCIGRGDSIESGKSYYLAEAEAIRDLLGASVDNQPHLFILDELYRGTNTVERIAAGRAVLEYLDHPPHLVLVATHDIELTHWLGERYVQFHFREQVVDGELTFDYRLKPGVSSTRNAIAWLEALGYPDEVVRVAEDTVERPSV